MRTSILLILSIVLLKSSYAQESVGFSDSTDFQYLIDYRLPSWGYSEFSLESGSFNFSRRLRKSRYEDENRDDSDRRIDYDGTFNVSPSYLNYKESEDLNSYFRTALYWSPTFSKDIDKYEDDNSEGETIDAKDEYFAFSNRISYSVDSDFTKYVEGDFFITARLDAYVGYTFQNSNTDSNNFDVDEQASEYEYIDRRISFYPEFGIGFGRVRNVTPILRALRLNERYKTISGASFNNDEKTYAAEQFTRYNSYRNRYERPLRYFWGDMDEGINNKLSSLTSFEQFYLNDVFDENLGARYEGYEMVLSSNYGYYNFLRRSDGSDRDLERSITVDRFAEINFDSRFYKNLNLENQISFILRNNLELPLERRDSEEWRFYSHLNANWLWLVVDRFQITSRVDVYYNTYKDKDVDDFNAHNLNIIIGPTFTYFIENKMSFSGNISYQTSRNYYNYKVIENNDVVNINNSISINANIKYYFNRALF